MSLEELLAKAQRLEIRSRLLARSQYAGLYRSAFKGQGVEFAEVREYSVGDDVRLIDWNVSARSSALYVKKMMEERDRNVLLLVDATGSLGFGTVQRTKYDLVSELAALFVLAGFQARDRISLAFLKERVEGFVPPGKGWNHSARLIREVVSRRPEGGSSDLEAVWSFLNSPGIRRSLVFILTDFQIPLVPSNPFSVAARKHEIIVLLVSDPREWHLPRIGRIRLADPETGEMGLINTSDRKTTEEFERRAQARRRSLLRLLRSNRIDWVEFSTALDYTVPLRVFLEERTARRGYRRR